MARAAPKKAVKKGKYHSPPANTDPPPHDLPVPATSRDTRLPGYRNLSSSGGTVSAQSGLQRGATFLKSIDQ